MIMKFKQEGRRKSGSYPSSPTSGVSPLEALFLPDRRTVTHGVQLRLGDLRPQLPPPPLLSLQSRGAGGTLLVSISGLPRPLPPIWTLGFSTLAGLRWGGSTSQGQGPLGFFGRLPQKRTLRGRSACGEFTGDCARQQQL